MGQENFLNIAGITIRLKSKEKPESDEKNDYRYKSFILDKRPSGIDIDLSLRIMPHYTKFNPKILFETRRKTGEIREEITDWQFEREEIESLQTNKLQKEEEGYLGEGLDWRAGKLDGKILFEGGTAGNFQVLLDGNLKKGEALLIKPNSRWKISDVVYGFLQVLSIYYLAKYRLGMVVHSAGIEDGAQGYLFIGPSRAGKTTSSRIWERYSGVKVLNDDRMIIRKENSRFYLYGTPWHGDFSDYLRTSTGRAKLKKLFFIYHRKVNKAERVSSICTTIGSYAC